MAKTPVIEATWTARRTATVPAQSDPLRKAETHYAAALARYVDGDMEAVAQFYQAAISAWHACQVSLKQQQPVPTRAFALYGASLGLLLESAQQHGLWDAESGLTVPADSGPLTIPVVLRGFSWNADDFQRLELVGDYRIDELPRPLRQAGWGVRLVVVRERPYDEQFFRREQPFAATALLRPSSPAVDDPDNLDNPDKDAAPDNLEAPAVLEFYDPARIGQVQVAGAARPLSADLTAPFAYSMLRRPSRAWQDFLQPGLLQQDQKLYLLEPHRPGKVPVVFIHGLLSEPMTWLVAAHELWAEPWFRERYELWAFRYPTGAPFLLSAAGMRRELGTLYQKIQNARPDPALSRMVLVGHSMGGLVAKLQITSSQGDRLWRSIAREPLDAIVAPPRQKLELADMFFFEPQPFVSRAVFIGTPHDGSSWANRLVGRTASCLVQPPPERRASHRRLVADNPDTFHPSVRRRVPTSIDLLEPGNPILTTIRRLPVAPHVHLHSVIGIRHQPLSHEPSDGVVPVDSARHPGVESEMLVPARHINLHIDPQTILFLKDILREHLGQPVGGEHLFQG